MKFFPHSSSLPRLIDCSLKCECRSGPFSIYCFLLDITGISIIRGVIKTTKSVKNADIYIDTTGLVKAYHLRMSGVYVLPQDKEY